MKHLTDIQIARRSSSTDEHSFRLVRHFSITAVISIAVAAIVLGLFYQVVARSQLTVNEERQHAEISRLFASLVWPEYGGYLVSVKPARKLDITTSAKHKALHELIQREISGSRILKIKIFNESGLTVYSTDSSQIGSYKNGYRGFELALQGTVTSNLSFRESFNKGDHAAILTQRHVVSSYVPISSSDASNNTKAVFELYSDVTPLMVQIASSRNKLVAVTIVTMLVLFAILLLNVRRADGIISAQAKAREQAEQQSRWQANHDALTNLPNQRYFKELLAQQITDNCAEFESAVLLFIDLDGFKPVNDRHGHQAGDEVLKTTAQRIKHTLPDTAMVARLGGDEFTVLLIVPLRAQSQIIDRHVNQLIQAIEKPVTVDSTEVDISASIGVTLCGNTSRDPDALIVEADIAMYQAKNSGRGCVRYYSTELGSSASQRILLEQEFRKAVDQELFEVQFLPCLDLRSNTIRSVEALARWRGTDGSYISPSNFISAAKSSGLIASLDRIVFSLACQHIADLESAGYGKLNLSVNVSAIRFEQRGLVEEVSDTLKSVGIAPDRVTFEVTEDVLHRDEERSIDTVASLHALGVSVVIDNFGSGHSSLEYIKTLKLSGLKLCQGFIANAPGNEQETLFLKALVQLASALQLSVVARCVESDEQVSFVKECGIYKVQGFRVAHPMSDYQLREFLDNHIRPMLRVVGGN